MLVSGRLSGSCVTCWGVLRHLLTCCFLVRPVPAVANAVAVAGQPPKRFRKDGDENVNDLQTFIGRGVSSLKSRVWSSKKSSGNGRTSLDDVSPTAAAAEDKV
jgi:hypothetical protein